MTLNFTMVPAQPIVRGVLILLLFILAAGALPALAATAHVSEANLVLPDLSDTSLAAFFGGASGWSLLFVG
ncbi:MAG TPA: hypothetical protein DCS31_10920, partial [Candidatus Competibacteraceae bacterium]|nr:hypothetical protein [Candidatus Competibacteraceae bacterium]